MPLTQELLLDVLAPPIVAGIAWVLGSVWSSLVGGGTRSDSARKWGKVTFLVILVGGYLMMFGATAYYRLVR